MRLPLVDTVQRAGLVSATQGQGNRPHPATRKGADMDSDYITEADINFVADADADAYAEELRADAEEEAACAAYYRESIKNLR